MQWRQHARDRGLRRRRARTNPPSYAQVTKVTGAQADPVHRRPGGLRRHRWPRPRAGLCGAGAGGVPLLQAQAQAEAGGGTLADIVKITTVLTDIRYRDELIPIREEFFGRKTPAVTQVAVSALGRPEWLIEVEAIAVL